MATMTDVRQIAWSIFWKWVLLALIGCVAGSLVIGTAIGAMYSSAALATGKGPLIMLVASILVSLLIIFLTLNFLLARSIGKQIGGKTLLLADALAAGENQDAH